MSISDNKKSWVGIINGSKCPNCYVYQTICLNCSAVQCDNDSDYDLTFGLMDFEEFKAAACDFSQFTYSQFRNMADGLLCAPFYLSNVYDTDPDSD